MFPSARHGPVHLVQAVLMAYHAAMQVIRSGKKEVVKFETPSGVTAVIDTSISDETLAKFARSLKAKLKRSAARSSNLVPKAK